MNFEYKITELRRAHGLTKEELAKRLQWPVENIINLEKGNIKPNDLQIDKISECFEISKENLLNNEFDIEYILEDLYKRKKNRISYREDEKKIKSDKMNLIVAISMLLIFVVTFFIMMRIFEKTFSLFLI